MDENHADNSEDSDPPPDSRPSLGYVLFAALVATMVTCGSYMVADELKRLNGELNSLDRSIGQFESRPAATEPMELASVTEALQRIDPIWEILHPDEQRRVLELLVETITVSKKDIEVRFRTNGIEQIVEELEPIGTGRNDGQR